MGGKRKTKMTGKSDNKLPEPVKAYKNMEFINSSDARTIRILAEFLEPMHRFRKYNIHDTIVFFGSARTICLQEAEQKLEEVQQRLDSSNQNSSDHVLQEELAYAKNQVFLARYYQDAVELARRMTEWSKSLNSIPRFVVSSGGGPGMMEAANKGALDAGGKSVGLNISLPMEQGSNAYITPELNFEFHYFFMRKFWLLYLAKALIIFPGGFGTLDELFETLTLIQTEKIKKEIPIIIYGKAYWDEVVNLDALVKYGTINKSDLELVRFCDTVDEAFEYLQKELTRIHLSDE